jgi:hypothetical protein
MLIWLTLVVQLVFTSAMTSSNAWDGSNPRRESYDIGNWGDQSSSSGYPNPLIRFQ